MANKNGTNKNGKKAKNKQVAIPFIGSVPSRGPWGNVFFYVFLIFLFFMIFGGSGSFSEKPEQVGVNELVKLIKDEKVQDVVVAGDKLEVQLKDGTKLQVEKESSISFDQILFNNGVDRSKIAGDVKIEHRVTLEQILTPLLMFGFPLIILYFIFKQMRGANSDIASFGKSRARLFKKGDTQITFNDVAGNEEAKTEMMEIVDFLKNSEKYRKLGARIPKGILLVGPSGVGKTLLAKAIAGEANVPFYSVAGSEFMEMLVGVGSSRVRDLFEVARTNQPSLIFIDEIDAIGRQRGMGIGGGHDEREQTLNQILIEMDGFDTRTDVIVLAATNRPDMLDPALIRPGRFDRRITVLLPDLKDREAIIKIHMREKPVAEEVKIEQIARKTVGFSGADIENMMNEAAILAARAGKTKIEQADIEEAALKVTIGSERKTLQTEEERRMTAYHEAGHALVSAFVEDMDPVNRVSIIARGASLGHTSFPPERDRYNETKTRLSSIMSTMLGGRAAEELVFGELTVGASDDIGKATGIARKMVAEWGMSSLGPVSYDLGGGQFWLARGIEEGSKVSEEMAAKIDTEVEKLIHNAYTHAKEIIGTNREKLDKIAAKLLEKETIDGEEFRTLVA
ncbi:MAG: ATP-dependent zinc metalloprotease FtsH [candidate division WWE3 bacterium GW2011_GWF2_41_45]|uniref:ATP-dependent zinc metalloprotease FtsH n=2 Tax=Katanobacteria TaxID=422282 RepID=A0A0G0VPD4_UNCKA|nr:MAG: ATP-dependent zinc metalloprotease FtsH [candidate division WWE3 bacterium GW2011_GWC2_41_23]KKS09560.1 MAG: ATP-dependent zinc metalloprotease FtsH [candidate division WWE3 bacterium GW2011_GWF2_41_45]KKS12128.1 MAG: ATP-dependent zinc metalloprotease FtsH [candidate division WWE3 bacterium GW2011_GWF1_41_53]KKS28073.1 MAG: ATP-dependent zinc protease/cell division protein, cell division protease FtsH [candidate division WWE3 bacterium GW2011_GWC1_42_102]KKS28864.1 MAG: ATP-dependent z